jgi:hypothetical protein
MLKMLKQSARELHAQPGPTARLIVSGSPPELLELILLALPMRDLLTAAQRVCKLWRSIITSVRALQQRLFLSPIGTNSRSYILPASALERGDFYLNPLMLEEFPLYANPRKFPIDSYQRPTRNDFDALGLTRHPGPFLRKGASWRRMLTQQPPAPGLALLKVTVHAGRRNPLEFHSSWFQPEDGQGLRMGVLYDTVFDFASQWTTGQDCTHGALYWAERQTQGLEDEFQTVLPELDDRFIDHLASDDPGGVRAADQGAGRASAAQVWCRARPGAGT